MSIGWAVKNNLTGMRSFDSESNELLGDEYFIDIKDGPPPVTAPMEHPKAVSASQVDSERDRRIDAGVTFGGVLYQSKTTDRENIAGAAQMAFMAVVGGAQPGNLRWSNPDQDFAWICAENTLVPMDAQTVVEFGRAAALRKSDLIYAGRALKDMPEIPENFTDDAWWPA